MTSQILVIIIDGLEALFSTCKMGRAIILMKIIRNMRFDVIEEA